MIVISTETYKSIVGFFKRNKPCNTVLKLCYNFLPLIMFVSYGILIVFMFFSDIKIFARITLSPLTVFAKLLFSEKYLTDLDRTKNLLLHLYSVKTRKAKVCRAVTPPVPL